MTSSLNRELYKATALTFDSLAFAIVSSELPPPDLTTAFDGAVRVGFHGCFDGHLVLGISGGILTGLTMSMLGEETSLAPQAQWDALGELANVICGRVLSDIAGNEKSFLVDAPCRVSETELIAPPDARAARIELGVEGGRADVLLVLDQASVAVTGESQP
jgi:CheY-specific phosphatase CheX